MKAIDIHVPPLRNHGYRISINIDYFSSVEDLLNKVKKEIKSIFGRKKAYSQFIYDVELFTKNKNLDNKVIVDILDALYKIFGNRHFGKISYFINFNKEKHLYLGQYQTKDNYFSTIEFKNLDDKLLDLYDTLQITNIKYFMPNDYNKIKSFSIIDEDDNRKLYIYKYYDKDNFEYRGFLNRVELSFLDRHRFEFENKIQSELIDSIPFNLIYRNEKILGFKYRKKFPVFKVNSFNPSIEIINFYENSDISKIEDIAFIDYIDETGNKFEYLQKSIDFHNLLDITNKFNLTFIANYNNILSFTNKRNEVYGKDNAYFIGIKDMDIDEFANTIPPQVMIDFLKAFELSSKKRSTLQVNIADIIYSIRFTNGKIDKDYSGSSSSPIIYYLSEYFKRHKNYVKDYFNSVLSPIKILC